jgi:hypothetical protein
MRIRNSLRCEASCFSNAAKLLRALRAGVDILAFTSDSGFLDGGADSNRLDHEPNQAADLKNILHHAFHGNADASIQQSIAPCSRMEEKLYEQKIFGISDRERKMKSDPQAVPFEGSPADRQVLNASIENLQLLNVLHSIASELPWPCDSLAALETPHLRRLVTPPPH